MNLRYFRKIMGSVFWIVCMLQISVAQGSLFGNLESRAQFFIRDTTIGAANTPQYDRQLYGAEAWLSLLYSREGFEMGLRFDLFHQTNLFNPQGSYSDQGIGRWFIAKDIDRLSIAAGYIYDQIGSGIIFRAYEERALGIDNALTGLKLTYDLSDQWTIKGFTGRQKNRFTLFKPIVKGLAVDGYVEKGSLSLTPGFGVVARTLDDANMNNLVASLNTYAAEDQFIPKFNTYAATVYTNLYYKSLSWYVEGSLKSKDAFLDPFGSITDVNGSLQQGNVFDQSAGRVLYTTMNYIKPGFGLTIEYKYTEAFTYRIKPQVTLNEGFVNFLPPMARQNTYRLTTLYVPATQEIGEQGLQVQWRHKWTKNWKSNAHVSLIENLDGQRLYAEYILEQFFTLSTESKLTLGLMYQDYNQSIYEQKPGVPRIKSIIPYFEYIRQFNTTKSLRLEGQYLATQQDRGSWLNAVLELGWAPRWLLSFSEMYNLGKNGERGAHYYTAGVVYSIGPNRFNVGYIRQVEGIVCAGGVCRFEPAFNGARIQVISNF